MSYSHNRTCRWARWWAVGNPTPPRRPTASWAGRVSFGTKTTGTPTCAMRRRRLARGVTSRTIRSKRTWRSSHANGLGAARGFAMNTGASRWWSEGRRADILSAWAGQRHSGWGSRVVTETVRQSKAGRRPARQRRAKLLSPLGGAGYAGSNRVSPGGNWNNNANNCRSAQRNNNNPSNRNNNIGFRVVLAPSQPARRRAPWPTRRRSRPAQRTERRQTETANRPVQVASGAFQKLRADSGPVRRPSPSRSEEHTSELQS